MKKYIYFYAPNNSMFKEIQKYIYNNFKGSRWTTGRKDIVPQAPLGRSYSGNILFQTDNKVIYTTDCSFEDETNYYNGDIEIGTVDIGLDIE